MSPDARRDGSDGRSARGGRTTTLAEWVPVAVGRIVEGFDPLRVILFGSLARGEAGRDSDLDLLVVVPDAAVGEPHDERRLEVDIRGALKDLPVPKDVVVSTPGEIARRGGLVGTVLRRALLEGEVLYERARETWEP